MSPRKSRLSTTVLLTASLAIASGCGGDDSSKESASGQQAPNPAAVFCSDQGGEYLLDSGECRLTDGTVVDAWEHFRQNKQ